jgi:hypothetical protein
MELENKIDIEETPQSRHRKKIAKEETARRARTEAEKVDKFWFEKNGNKLTKVTRMKNGNAYSEFVGMITKERKAEAEMLLKKHPKPSDQ